MRRALRNHQEVCQIWAEQKQDIGYAGNVSFRHDTIFSYVHWPMARFIRPNVVLYRRTSYSKSTSKHRAYVGAALRRCSNPPRVFNVWTTHDHQENIADYLWCVRRFADAFWNCREYPDIKMRRYNDIVSETKAYIAEFMPEYKLPALFGLELSGQLAEKKL